jgi:O-methyltransferase
MLARFWRVLSEPQRLRDAASRRLSPDAFRRPLGPCADDPHRFFARVPDRYTWNLNKYLQRGGTDCLETRSKYLFGNDRNPGDLTRYYFLKLVCDQLLKEQIIGDAAELGVWKGNTAAIIAEFTRRTGTTTYLLDTFEGFEKDDLTGIDADKAMEFADTSVNCVADLVGAGGIKFVKGYFPDTQDQIPIDARFAFVHIDCDLYKPLKAGLEFFYPRLVKGGFLVMHDYSSLYWDGVEKAVDDFFADKSEAVIPIPDVAGTAVIRKIGLHKSSTG